jgi:hypothetical protein
VDLTTVTAERTMWFSGATATVMAMTVEAVGEAAALS